MSFKLSIIVPCFNEAKVIREIASRLMTVASSQQLTFEIIFINDGSTDATLQILGELCATQPSIKCISFSRNFGHQAAVSAGILNASGNVAIIMDADLQDPPELIPAMIALWMKEKSNVVYGVRTRRENETWFKKNSAKLYYRLLSSLSDVHIPNDSGDFRLIDKAVIDAFRCFPERHKYIRGLIGWMGYKQVPFYYERQGRFAGETKYSLLKMLHFGRYGLVYFTKKPLRLAMNLGILCLFFGIILIAYVFISKYYFPQTTVKGWSSILIAVVFFGGVQLLSIGLIGEYIGSIFDEVKGRPEFIMEKKINF